MVVRMRRHGSELLGAESSAAGTQGCQFAFHSVSPLQAPGDIIAMAAPPQLRGLLLAVNALLRKRRYHAALAVLKGFRNGAV